VVRLYRTKKKVLKMYGKHRICKAATWKNCFIKTLRITCIKLAQKRPGGRFSGFLLLRGGCRCDQNFLHFFRHQTNISYGKWMKNTGRIFWPKNWMATWKKPNRQNIVDLKSKKKISPNIEIHIWKKKKSIMSKTRENSTKKT
jgi:hypothetical protein